MTPSMAWMRRLFRIVAAAMSAGASLPDCAGAEPSPAPWFERALVGMEVGPTGAQFGLSDPTDVRFGARFDGREIVREARRANSEYLVLWVRDGDYAYYDSKLLPKAPGLGVRDPLREAMDEAAKVRLPVVAYCVVQQGGHFLKAHPEWEMRGADGKPLGRFCYNSGYLEAMKQILAEPLAYGIAGFHIDMMDQGFGPPYGCWCDSCKREFEGDYGRPMPPGPTWDAAWDQMLEFRYRSSERFEKALAAYIRAIDPAVTVDFNYHGNPPFSFEVGQRPVQHAGNGDFITGETGVWGFSALTVGLNAEFYRAAVPAQRVQVAMQRGVRMYHDQTTRPLNDLRWELFTLLAHGAFVTMVDKTGFDGGLDPVAYDRTGVAFAEALRKRIHFGQSRVAEVGLYFSSRSRDWIGRERAAEWFGSFLGAHRALVYEHIPYGVILDESVTPEVLRRFPIVLLPNVGIVSEREVGLLKQYVEDGGHLILTGLTGGYGPRGTPIASNALESLVGARFAGSLDSLDNWVRLPARKSGAGKSHGPAVAGASPEWGEGEWPTGRRGTNASPADWPFLVKGPAAIYQVLDAAGSSAMGARPFGQLSKPYRTVRQQEGREGTEWPMSADQVVGPAILLNRVGRGAVITFACSPDYATASEHATVEARHLLRDAIRYLIPAPRVRIDAPAHVEAVVTDEPRSGTLRVHLLAYLSPPQTMPAKNRPFVLPTPVEDRPLYRATIRLETTPKRVSALDPATRIRRRGRDVEVTVEDVHDVLLIRYRQ